MNRAHLLGRVFDRRTTAAAVLTLAGLFGAAGASAAWAQGMVVETASAPTALAADSSSDNAMVNLVRLLVKQGVITQAAGDGLVLQAKQEAAHAVTRAQGEAQLQTLGQVPGSPALADLPPPPAGSMRVAYVPETVKDEIRAELKQDVLNEAKTQNWAQPNAIPSWVNRIAISGDLRMRDQHNLYSNNNTNEYIDFATFNANGPTDINPDTNPNGLPFLDTRRDRNDLFAIRARLAFDVHINDFVSGGLRIATGNDNNPVSTTQLLGGGLDKKNIWLDRAFINIQPEPWAKLTLGRMPNPFFSTDLVYDDDLNFDGIAAGVRHTLPVLTDGLELALTGGAFPIDYQANNFPTNDTDKGGERAKWLFGGDLVASWTQPRFLARIGAGYYDFNSVQGQISQPCELYNGNKQCSTDFSRPAFMQKGNTLFFVRDITPDPSNPLDYAQPQYLGLRFKYQILDLNADLDLRLGERRHLIFAADYARNVGYDASDICRNAPLGLPVNNLNAGASGSTNPCGGGASFKSGPNAYLAKVLYGDPVVDRFGAWNLVLGYKYIEPDAVLDAFTNDDFHLGGTNAQGYFILGAFGLYDDTFLQLRWFSANEVFGPPLSIDVGQIDLNVKF